MFFIFFREQLYCVTLEYFIYFILYTHTFSVRQRNVGAEGCAAAAFKLLPFTFTASAM